MQMKSISYFSIAYKKSTEYENRYTAVDVHAVKRFVIL